MAWTGFSSPGFVMRNPWENEEYLEGAQTDQAKAARLIRDAVSQPGFVNYMHGDCKRIK